MLFECDIDIALRTTYIEYLGIIEIIPDPSNEQVTKRSKVAICHCLPFLFGIRVGR